MSEVTYPQLSGEALIMLAIAFYVGMVLIMTPLFYPFRLLFTTVHELGHVFAVVLTGGKVKGFWVYFKSKQGVLGLTERDSRISGDSRLFFSGGYLGTALFSTGLILLSGLPKLAPISIGVLGGILILLALFEGRGCTWLIGLILGGLFIWVALYQDWIWSVFLLYLLAILGALTAISDWRVLTKLARQDPGGSHDPGQMAKVAGCSARFWATTWSLITFLLLGIAFWFVWLRRWS
jgi:hypothetical protein